MAQPGLFSETVLDVIDGRAGSLRQKLADHPGLVRERAESSHRATLLHYVSANGVEDELQRSPANAVEIAEVLLGAGAEVDATCETYGGGSDQTTLCLLVSSWHPYERRVQDDLIRTLTRHGARVDGLRDDGMPLATALVFGYTGAARTLVQCGARVDNLFFAAGLGDIEKTLAFFDEEGRLGAAALGTYRPPIAKTLPASHAAIAQEALMFAVTHGAREVADALLSRGASVDGTVTGHHCALPLAQAGFVHELGMVEFLLERGADLSRIDDKQGRTPAEMASAEVKRVHDRFR